MLGFEINDIVISGDIIIMFNTNNLELINKMTKDKRWDLVSVHGNKICYRTHDVPAIIEFLKEVIKDV